MAKVVIQEEALDEAKDARLWLRDRQPRTVAGFRRRFNAAKANLAKFPYAGAAELDGLRRLPLTPYPYSLIYRVDGDTVTIVAVRHASREPGSWRGR